MTKRKVLRKSILKRPAPDSRVEEEEEEEDNSLFNLLLPSGTAVALVASDWRARYSADPTAALAELYTLVARVRPFSNTAPTRFLSSLVNKKIKGGAHIFSASAPSGKRSAKSRLRVSRDTRTRTHSHAFNRARALSPRKSSSSSRASVYVVSGMRKCHAW